MRNLVCRDCGKRYDYDKDDFCPKCGSYNPPQEAPSTRLERELLSRFGTARESQTRAKGQQQARHAASAQPRTPSRPHTPPPRPAPGAAAAERPQARHGQHIEDCPACGPDLPEKGRRAGPSRAIIGIVAIIILVAAVNIALQTAVRKGVQNRFDTYFVTGGRAEPERPAGSGPVFAEHVMGDPFALNSVEVTVDNVWRVDLTGDALAGREGFNCLAVDVWITGGERQRDLYIAVPQLALDAETETYPAEDDMFLSKRLSDYGVYAVTLSDYQWEDPLYGQFVFFVPEGAAGEAELILEEYAPGDVEDPELIGVHSVRFPLP